MILFRKLEDNDNDYNMLYKWCSKKHVYEWFEQRVLSFDEIKEKYKNKLKSNKEDLFIINYNNIDIGLVQIYRSDYYEDSYEYDLFIGEEDYLNKGIGTEIVNKINKMIYENYNTNSIILRPFKRNQRAISCYRKCNFKVIDEYNGYDTLNNPELITVLISTK